MSPQRLFRGAVTYPGLTGPVDDHGDGGWGRWNRKRSGHGAAADAFARLFSPRGGRKALPHWILIRVGPASVQLFASTRKGSVGFPFAEFAPGTFSANLSRNIGEVSTISRVRAAVPGSAPVPGEVVARGTASNPCATAS